MPTLALSPRPTLAVNFGLEVKLATQVSATSGFCNDLLSFEGKVLFRLGFIVCWEFLVVDIFRLLLLLCNTVGILSKSTLR